jgi:hypothetical protein
MLTALVLVCSLTATPDLAACNRDNAVDVMRVPEEFGNPATCFMSGQAYLAQTEIGRDLSPDDRIKVVCMPSKVVEMTVRPALLR